MNGKQKLKFKKRSPKPKDKPVRFVFSYEYNTICYDLENGGFVSETTCSIYDERGVFLNKASYVQTTDVPAFDFEMSKRSQVLGPLETARWLIEHQRAAALDLALQNLALSQEG